MRCRDCRALPPGYTDGQVAPELAGMVAAHLATCAGCQSLLERERQTRRLLTLAADADWTPPDLRLRIALAIDRPPHRRLLQAPSALGALLGVAALGIALLHGGLGSFQAAAPSVTAPARHVEHPGNGAPAIVAAQPQPRFDPLLAERTLAYSSPRTLTYPPLPPDWPADDRQSATNGSKGGEAHPARPQSRSNLLAY